MNTYRYKFWAQCPSDKAQILYHLQIQTDDVIMAERIERECKFNEPVYHEDAADGLLKKFGGRQTLEATHGRVNIVTERGVHA